MGEKSSYGFYIEPQYVDFTLRARVDALGSQILTSSSCHPKVFVKEFCYFLMSCHQHCLGVNLLVQR